MQTHQAIADVENLFSINPLRLKLILVCQKMQKIARIRNNKSLIYTFQQKTLYSLNLH